MSDPRNAASLARVQQIQSLRMTGIPPDEVRHLLDQPGLTAQRAVQLRFERLEAHNMRQQRIAERLQ